MNEVTKTLSRYLVNAKAGDVPEAVRKEAVRSFFNWLGCAVGGSVHETVDRALSALRPFAGPQQATLLGRGERIDILNAALLNGISSHVFDFDDTHLKTIIHPAGPVAGPRRHRGGPGRPLLAGRARAPGLSGADPERLHLPFRAAGLEAAGATGSSDDGDALIAHRAAAALARRE